MTYIIADHNGCNFAPTEGAKQPAFDRNGEYCGQVHSTAAWAVPNGIHAEMGLPNHLPLYLTDAGHWAPTFEAAEYFLAHTKPPEIFMVKGACLNLFANWPESEINTHADYRFTKSLSGSWEIEELGRFVAPAKEIKRAAVSANLRFLWKSSRSFRGAIDHPLLRCTYTSQGTHIMQSLKLQTFNNIQTGNVAELLINDSGVCVYYQEICTQGVVKAGHDQDEMFWASWTPENGLACLMTSEWPCLDDALSGLETILEDQLTPSPWHSETTGL